MKYEDINPYTERKTLVRGNRVAAEATAFQAIESARANLWEAENALQAHHPDMAADMTTAAGIAHDTFKRLSLLMFTPQPAAPIVHPAPIGIDKPMPCAKCGHIFESADMREIEDDLYCDDCYDAKMSAASYTKEDYQADQFDNMHSSGEIAPDGTVIR